MRSPSCLTPACMGDSSVAIQDMPSTSDMESDASGVATTWQDDAAGVNKVAGSS
jgi:hypothetical protein